MKSSVETAVMIANRLFNEELIAFSRGTQKGVLHLGIPSQALQASGLNETEMFITPKVLKSHLEKHGLTPKDIRNLPMALQNPLLVYGWGTMATSLIAITEIPRGDSRITVAIKLERGGKRVEINELASIHAKDVDRFLLDMANAKEGGVEKALRWISDKEKTLAWLGLVPPKGTASLTTQGLSSIAKIIQKFENPKVESLSMAKKAVLKTKKNRGFKL